MKYESDQLIIAQITYGKRINKAKRCHFCKYIFLFQRYLLFTYYEYSLVLYTKLCFLAFVNCDRMIMFIPITFSNGLNIFYY